MYGEGERVRDVVKVSTLIALTNKEATKLTLPTLRAYRSAARRQCQIWADGRTDGQSCRAVCGPESNSARTG